MNAKSAILMASMFGGAAAAVTSFAGPTCLAADELPANHPPVSAPVEQPVPAPAEPFVAGEQPVVVSGGFSGGGSSGGRSGQIFIDGGSIKADGAALDSGGALAIVADGLVDFTATQPGAMSRAAYLGVATSSPDTALQKQLQLKAGVGLVVDGVEPASPAEQAGVRQYDVLHKLDDQLLINTDQLAVLVRGYEPGKEVTLTVIREGKSQTLTAKLVERAVPPLRLSLRSPTQTAPVTFRANPRFYAEAANNLLVGKRDGVVLQTPDGKSQVSATQFMIDDGKHKMTITSPGGRKRLKVEDKAGKVLFDGPIDTREDVEKAPVEVRKLYQSVLRDFASPKAAAAASDEDAPAPTKTAPAPTPTPTTPAPQR